MIDTETSFKMAILVKFSILVIYLGCVERSSGHVALTFPPARDYSLDFLDNARTKPPCGMPKGRLTLTNIVIFDKID